MTETLFTEVTGVQLHSEKDSFLTDQEFTTVHDDLVERLSYHTDTNFSHNVLEFYFMPEELNAEISSPAEQFSVSMVADHSADSDYVVSLRKKSKIGELTNERFTKLTGEQLSNILYSQYEWMKNSCESLILEFYNKLKLWKLKICLVLEYTREQFYMKDKNVSIRLDLHNAIYNLGLSDTHPYLQKLRVRPYHLSIRNLDSAYKGLDCLESLEQLANQKKF